MKHNRMKGRLSFPAHADHVLERIRIITRELENIQAEIYSRIGEALSPDKGGLFRDDSSAPALARFRTVLDQTRNMLWLCTEAGESAPQSERPQRDRQLAQAAALLRALAPSNPPAVSSTAMSSSPQSGAQGPVSFFDRLERVIDNYVEGGGTLLEPSPRRSPKT